MGRGGPKSSLSSGRNGPSIRTSDVRSTYKTPQYTHTHSGGRMVPRTPLAPTTLPKPAVVPYPAAVDQTAPRAWAREQHRKHLGQPLNPNVHDTPLSSSIPFLH